MQKEKFRYSDEHFADLQMLRYRLNDFEKLSIKQKKLVKYKIFLRRKKVNKNFFFNLLILFLKYKIYKIVKKDKV